MIDTDAVLVLAALAQDHRLRLFRLLIQAGPEGLAAGAIAEQLGLAPSSLSFHLNELYDAGLIRRRRDGRSLIYAANYPAMDALITFLTDNCCGGEPCNLPSKPRQQQTETN